MPIQPISIYLKKGTDPITKEFQVETYNFLLKITNKGRTTGYFLTVRASRGLLNNLQELKYLVDVMHRELAVICEEAYAHAKEAERKSKELDKNGKKLSKKKT